MMCNYTSACVCEFQRAAAKQKAKGKKKKTEDIKQTDATGEGEEEEIPQLVPIATPSKKPKLEVSATHSCQI